MSNVYSILAEVPEGKRKLGRRKFRQDYKIKIDLRERE
jgi:hypothetical protein